MRKLKTALRKMGVNCDTQKIEMLEEYMMRLLEKNRGMNLTAITDRKEFIEKHYLDSLVLLSIDEFKNAKTVIDVGTGGGFPGIPLAICAPEKEFLLIDSLSKRLNVVMETANATGVKNVAVVHGRAEDLGKKTQYRERFGLCVSRAVAPLAVLAEYCIPFIKVGGKFVAYKTEKATEEIEQAKKAIVLMGGFFDRVESEFGLPATSHHTLVMIGKERPTPIRFPRKSGTPTKKPLVIKSVSRETSDINVEKPVRRRGRKPKSES